MVLAVAARLGPTNSSRARACGSVMGNSYCPSTRAARKPDSAPTSTASSVPMTARIGAASAPNPSACLSITGSMTVRMEPRLIAAHSPRSTVCGSGSPSGADSPVYSETSSALRAAKSCTSPATAALSPGGGPVWAETAFATRSAKRQSTMCRE